jgi:hypothetical protein
MSELNLTNSKGRIVAEVHKLDDGTYSTEYDGGHGCGYKKIQDTFLTLSCCWCDNPSCKAGGSDSAAVNDFLEYCRNDKYCKALIGQFK